MSDNEIQAKGKREFGFLITLFVLVWPDLTFKGKKWFRTYANDAPQIDLYFCKRMELFLYHEKLHSCGKQSDRVDSLVIGLKIRILTKLSTVAVDL